MVKARMIEKDICEYNIFGNTMVGSRFLTRVKIDELCNEREQLIHDVSNGEFTELLEKAYDDLGLVNFNLDEQYMILRVVSSYIKYGKISFDMLMSDLKQKEVSELLKEANTFRWLPMEISELQAIRNQLLYNGYNKNFIDDIKKKLKEAYKIIKVTNYKYIRRKKVLSEYNTIKKDILELCRGIKI